MKIRCNGEERRVAEGSTVFSMIVELGLEPDHVVAECDGAIVRRDAYESTPLQDGSVVELIRFVGGG
ncbi:MAG: sulfur carrier protein ThiS [Deltaproteobacteria bacterium]